MSNVLEMKSVKFTLVGKKILFITDSRLQKLLHETSVGFVYKYFLYSKGMTKTTLLALRYALWATLSQEMTFRLRWY